MQKHIPLSELTLGMFIHKMEGSWFDHPFWSARFLLDDKGKLAKLKQSQLDGVIIDTSKGKDVAIAGACNNGGKVPTPGSPSAGVSSRAKARIGSIKARASVEEIPPRPTSTQAELGAAQNIANKAQDRMSKVFLSARLGKALNTRTVEPIVNDILTSVRRNPHAFGGLMRCKLRNQFVYRHSLAVSALMISLARQMKLSKQKIYEAGLAGLFLDIGTNYMPADLEPKDNDYRNAGVKIWQQHVMLGYRALQNDDTLPKSVMDACLQHHERLDGGGFPHGITGDDIGEIGRMAAICDCFDFLLTKSDTNCALDPAQAIQKMGTMQGAFDTDILRKFIEAVGLYPIGSFVQLRSKRLALVIDEDKDQSDKPVVQAFYCTVEQQQIKPHRIELAKAADTDAIMGIADLSAYHLPETDHLREMIFLRSHKIACPDTDTGG